KETVAQAHRTAHDGVEHWLDIDWRATDHAKNLAGCRLLLQRFGEITVPSLQFLKEPHVLDGDDGLVGEGLEQGDIRLRKPSGFTSGNGDGADRHPFTHHRHGEPASIATRPRALLRRFRVFGSFDVIDTHYSGVYDGPAAWIVTVGWLWVCAAVQHLSVRADVIESADVHEVSVVAKEYSERAIEKADSVADDGVENRLLISRRARD